MNIHTHTCIYIYVYIYIYICIQNFREQVYMGGGVVKGMIFQVLHLEIVYVYNMNKLHIYIYI